MTDKPHTWNVPRVILSVALAALAIGLIAYEVTHGVFQRMWENLIARPSGPLAFRFLLQPAMATIAAVRDGLKDARTGRSPYFWTVLSRPEERRARVAEGLDATGRIIALGLIMDAAYQYLVLGKFYPGEALIVAFVLAFLPYLLIRGLVARLARWWGHRPSSTQMH